MGADKNGALIRYFTSANRYPKDEDIILRYHQLDVELQDAEAALVLTVHYFLDKAKKD